MTYENVQSISLAAASGADIPIRRFVSQGSGGIALTGDGLDTVGVSLEAYDDSEFALGNASNVLPVASNIGAKVEIEASEAVAVGDDVASAASGKAKTSATGDFVQGIALTATAADGEVLTVLITRSAVAPSA